MWFVITSVAVALLPESAHAEPSCRRVFGIFWSSPAAECASPVGICTEGKLRGRLRADYAFTMDQVIPSNDGSIPTVSFFTGLSDMKTRRGALFGTDAGSIDFNPIGFGRFTTLITITGGTGKYRGATGFLQIRGKLDFFTGGARGDYYGMICRTE